MMSCFFLLNHKVWVATITRTHLARPDLGGKNCSYFVGKYSNTSFLKPHPRFYRLLMKGIFDAYVLWHFYKKVVFLISNVRQNFTVCLRFHILFHILPVFWIINKSAKFSISNVTLLTPSMKFEKDCGQIPSCAFIKNFP